MNEGEIKRVRYFDRQFLRTSEFRDEQSYHVSMRRRHNLSHHTWGIVNGLKLIVQDQVFFVDQGMAIDGFGRELLLPNRRRIPTDAFVEHDNDELDVWLRYGKQPSDKVRSTKASCNGNGQATRDREYPIIELRVPSPATANRREPPELSEAELNFSVTSTSPDDPNIRWPVFLGQIVREPLNPERSEFDFRVNPADRPYVGLRGERVVAPSERAMMQLGAESTHSPYRFAISVPDAASQPGVPQSTQPTKNGLVDNARIFVDRENNVGIHGDTTVHGDFTIAEGHSIIFEDQPTDEIAGVGVTPGSSIDRIEPWQIYRVLRSTPAKDSEQTASTPTDNNREHNNRADNDDSGTVVLTNELRIVMDGLTSMRDESPVVNEIVIGATDDEGFKDGLTITQGGDVIVHGNLKVNGTLDANGGTSDDTLKPETRQLLASLFQSAITAAGGSITEQVTAIEQLLETPQGKIVAAGTLIRTAEGLREVAGQLLKEDPENPLVALLKLLLANVDKLRDDLVTLLGKDGASGDEKSARKTVAGAVANVGNDDDARPPFAEVIKEDLQAGGGEKLFEGLLKILLEALPDVTDKLQPLAQKLLSSDNRCDAIVGKLTFDFGSGNASDELQRFVSRLETLTFPNPSDPTLLEHLMREVFATGATDRMAAVAQSLPESPQSALVPFVDGLTSNQPTSISDADLSRAFVSVLIDHPKGMEAINRSFNNSTTRVTDFGTAVKAFDAAHSTTLAAQLIAALS